MDIDKIVARRDIVRRSLIIKVGVIANQYFPVGDIAILILSALNGKRKTNQTKKLANAEQKTPILTVEMQGIL